MTTTYYWNDESIVGTDALEERIEQGFAEIESLLPSVDSIAWDECHKIYLLMNDEQTAFMQGYPMRVRASDVSAEELMDTLRFWYDSSCPLRFIQSCDGSVEDTKFESHIPQIFWDEETHG